MNNPDHISDLLETIFGLKYLNSLMRLRNPVWKKLGSGINIPDPQHCTGCGAGGAVIKLPPGPGAVPVIHIYDKKRNPKAAKMIV